MKHKLLLFIVFGLFTTVSLNAQIKFNFYVDDYRVIYDGNCPEDCSFSNPGLDPRIELDSYLSSDSEGIGYGSVRINNQWWSLNCTELNPLPKQSDISPIQFISFENREWFEDTTIRLDMDAAEEDNDCNLFLEDDASCGGFGTLSNIKFMDYAPCIEHEFWLERTCTSDGATATWGVHVRFSYEFVSPRAGSIETRTSPTIPVYCVDSDLPTINSETDTTLGFIQWERQEHYTDGSHGMWQEVSGANDLSYDPGVLSSSTTGLELSRVKYRRVLYPCNSDPKYSNEVYYDIAALIPYYSDNDGDGYGGEFAFNFCPSDAINFTCIADGSCVSNNLDCDDTDENINPDGVEICDRLDNDCDGLIDDDDPDVTDKQTWYEDVDGDGFGDTESSLIACFVPDGYVDNGDDNCVSIANPDQLDADCDGVGDACDICPGSDDKIDVNNNGVPDCMDSDLPDYALLPDKWKCEPGSNDKIYIHHDGEVLCIAYPAALPHIRHGDVMGLSQCSTTMRKAINTLSVENPRVTTGRNHFYPNPTTGLVYFPEEYHELRVYNAMGQLLQTAKKASTIDIRELKPGLYFVEIGEGTEKRTYRIIKK